MIVANILPYDCQKANTLRFFYFNLYKLQQSEATYQSMTRLLQKHTYPVLFNIREPLNKAIGLN